MPIGSEGLGFDPIPRLISSPSVHTPFSSLFLKSSTYRTSSSGAGGRGGSSGGAGGDGGSGAFFTLAFLRGFGWRWAGASGGTGRGFLVGSPLPLLLKLASSFRRRDVCPCRRFALEFGFDELFGHFLLCGLSRFLYFLIFCTATQPSSAFTVQSLGRSFPLFRFAGFGIDQNFDEVGQTLRIPTAQVSPCFVTRRPVASLSSVATEKSQNSLLLPRGTGLSSGNDALLTLPFDVVLTAPSRSVLMPGLSSRTEDIVRKTDATAAWTIATLHVFLASSVLNPGIGLADVRLSEWRGSCEDRIKPRHRSELSAYTYGSHGKDWKGIVISIAVIAFLSCLILLVIFLTSPELHLIFPNHSTSSENGRLNPRVSWRHLQRAQPLAFPIIWRGDNELLVSEDGFSLVFLRIDASKNFSSESEDRLLLREPIPLDHHIRFSPNGSLLLFGIYDLRMLNTVPHPLLKFTSHRKETDTPLRYAIPGHHIPNVTLAVFHSTRLDNRSPSSDFRAPVLKSVQLPRELILMERYVPEATWINDTSVILVVQPRSRNQAYYLLCQESEDVWTCAHMFVRDFRHQNFRGPLPVSHISCVVSASSPNLSKLLILEPVLQGSRGHFAHITLVPLSQWPLPKPVPITHGYITVAKILFWDSTFDIIYFLGVPSKQPTSQHLYEVRTTSGSTLSCVTCSLFPWFWNDTATSWTFFDASFSPNGRLVVFYFLGPSIPKVELFSRSYQKQEDTFSWKHIQVLTNNSHITELFEEIQLRMPRVERQSLQMVSGYEADIRVITSNSILEDNEQRLPILLWAPARSGTCSVTDQWTYEISHVLAEVHQWTVVTVDLIGAGCRGFAHERSFYGNPGVEDVDDALEVLRYVIANTSETHGNFRVGVVGKHYAAYATSRMLTEVSGTQVRCGTAIAPITAWNWHRATATESLLGEFNMETLSRYSSSGLSEVDLDMDGHERKFLLIHEADDEDVLLQQSIMLSHQLVNKGYVFQQLFYPPLTSDMSNDQHQGYYSHDDRMDHQWKTIESFFLDCFESDDDAAFANHEDENHDETK
ncbi:unnamed protein product [Cyprideis torosa]|uniref:Uncharacterized protein n=1 Tax=Cyprideis torosa TaxID=163714 RepID=A0A7R8ZLG4_9CRUS|nr:unnamed protein product [Cyprideis torosa]CAG0882218.1 unnamed protein product [Cyprideis torosa]